MNAPGMNRRRFLRVGLGAGGGLVVAFAVPGAARLLGEGPTGAAGAVAAWSAGGALDTLRFGAFVAVDTGGVVTVRIPVPEIGQGVRTSLAMIVAEELEVPWSSIRVEQADAADDLGPHPMAGGSNAVRAYWTPLREAGAAARELLVRAAAERWDAPPEGCVARDGTVEHRPSGRRVGYGEVAADAARLPLPESPALKSPDDFTLVGSDVVQIDAAAVADGTVRFGLDVSVPGMVRAVVARCPVYGGTVASWDDTAALSVPGVRRTVKVDAVGAVERPYSVEGVAVVADDTWSAIRGREALEVSWDDGPNTGESTDRLAATCAELLERPGAVWREEGDVDAALAAAARTVEATYTTPFLVHAPMEPMNCVVHVDGDRCEIWAPTQVPLSVRRNVAAMLEVPEASVVVHTIRSGGGFGRRLAIDFVLEAIPVARAVGVPVQVVWTREDDMCHGVFRPYHQHRLVGGLDEAGGVVAWLYRQAGTSRYAFRPGEDPADSAFRAGTWPGAFVPAQRLEYHLAESNLPRGPLRAPGYNAFVFAVESFLDELAHAGGRDPLELRLDLVGPARSLPDLEGTPPFETARMAGVLRAAADRAGWGEPLPEGVGRGIAANYVFGSYAAEVAEVEATSDGRGWRVRRIVGALDCGRVVHPSGARAQVEGGILDGLGAALHGRVTVEGGRVVQSNFHDFPLLRASEVPVVETVLVDSDAPPTGAGEPPYPPVGAAVANAVFAATGVRLRELPLGDVRRAASGRTGAD